MSEVNWEFVKGCDRLISELALNDWKNRKNKRKNNYTLSANTEYLLNTKKDYVAGKIDEETAKAIFLNQRLNGNAI